MLCFAALMNAAALVHRLRRIARPYLRPFVWRFHRYRRRATGRVAAGPVPLGPRRGRARVLMLAWYDPRGLKTIVDHVESIGRLSRFDYDLMNLYGHEGAEGTELPESVRLAEYDALLVHVTAAYDVYNLISLDRRRTEKIAGFPGVKAMMKQDENLRTNLIIDYLEARSFDLLMTCVPEEHVRSVYPSDRLPRLRFLQTLTGYVTEEMRSLRFAPVNDRPIDIGYRGNARPFVLGRLPYEKWAIGERFKDVCRERGLSFDISSRPQDRILGGAWLEFLGRCKGTLGVESGASVFDFTGELIRACDEYLARHPGATFEEVEERILAPHEGRIPYGQIGPRHFEAAACRTVQILYEGRYSGIFQPGRHYLSLRRDHGNLDEVMERFADPAQRKALTEAAFDEIVMNDAYRYETFVGRLDESLEPLLLEKAA